YELAYNRGPFAFPPASLNPNLTEETSRGYDLGIEYNAANGLHLEATYFDQEIEDAIEFDLAGFSGYLQTRGTSTSKGVELAAHIPVSERWELLANWTYNDTEDSAGEQRVRRPKNLGNLGVLYRTANERLSVLANYRVSRDAVDTTFLSLVPLPDYEVLDLSVTFDASEMIQIYGRVQNATDETYYEVLNYNTAEQAIYGGLRLRF
ncbi:MAG TPA: TonB-dependent receptor, partial [Gammaproteobacteria bacterium]